MTSARHRLSLWLRALLVLVGTVLLASPVLVHHYQQARNPGPAVWPVPEDPVAARKARMINRLLPLIQASNQELMNQRERLQRLRERVASGKHLKGRDFRWLKEQAVLYRLTPPESNPPKEKLLTLLNLRLDLVPADLALAQAAMESAWGTSRFAREGNNFFGHWCFEPGCGIVPSKRANGASHEVARFDSPGQSVARYMHNLNSHPSDRGLRLIREQQREQGLAPDGYAMAAGLESYSGIGNEYVRAIRALIRSNKLGRFPSL